LIPTTSQNGPQHIENGSQYGDLGSKAFRALRKGDTFGADSTRSAALRSALLGMVNAGWSFDKISDAVLDRANFGGRKVQDVADQRGMARAMKLLHREHDQAVAYVRRNSMVLDRNGALFAVADWRERVDGAVWRGSGGLTNRNALFAMADQAARTGSSTRVPMSVRTLAETVGCSSSTASMSLRRMTAAGWLAFKAKTDGDHPALYALTVPSEATRTPSHIDPVGEVFDLLHSHPGHDVWRWQGLGKGPHRVYDAITQKISAAAEIASVLGISTRAVYQHLRTLREAGLVASVRGLWYPTDRALEAVASELGVAGLGVAQRRRHAQQRDGYHGAMR
jgi:predicted ArsR family transcriptional regulator